MQSPNTRGNAHRHRTTFVSLVAALALVLAACGEGEEPAAAPDDPAPEPVDATADQLTILEWAGYELPEFNPAFLEQYPDVHLDFQGAVADLGGERMRVAVAALRGIAHRQEKALVGARQVAGSRRAPRRRRSSRRGPPRWRGRARSRCAPTRRPREGSGARGDGRAAAWRSRIHPATRAGWWFPSCGCWTGRPRPSWPGTRSGRRGATLRSVAGR